MRPTDLHFRSPNEFTAEYRLPLVTYTGRRLEFSVSKRPKVSPTFSKATRFAPLRSRPNPLVGPGSYNPSTYSFDSTPSMARYAKAYYLGNEDGRSLMMVGSFVKKMRSVKNFEIVKRCRKYLEESFDADKSITCIRGNLAKDSISPKAGSKRLQPLRSMKVFATTSKPPPGLIQMHNIYKSGKIVPDKTPTQLKESMKLPLEKKATTKRSRQPAGLSKSTVEGN
eukprot:TRINITY_DN6076_c0_g1_i4.p1 TRINITY_DN6076_c0_g1~~TRINITY_DN6076_c0_g1_i4.p1  ORF type:complete len:225 (-),score=17.59 TRINITY_DN6076_c0_g1_i4:134-808(-)